MNVLDSELVIGDLRQAGYQVTPNAKEADVILFNTCSVRQHAEDKIYSALGRLRRAKERRPSLVIGVLGCMAQKDQSAIFKRAPHVDFIVSPGQLAKTAELVEQSRVERRPRSALGLARQDGGKLRILASFESFDPLRDPALRPTPFQAYVRVMMGCDKFCAFCIVPSVRGPEQARPPEAILAEVKQLAGEGAKEITLLGQTVNSYRYRHEDGRVVRLSDVLERIHDTPGLARIKFITNFPKDMSGDLLDAVRALPKVSPHLHVPVQSGCDKVLAAMKRGYTSGEYRDMLHRVRAEVPSAAISSDFIVGFPGENAESFERSVELLREARFKNAFVFKYSPREGTKSFALIEDVSEEEKKRRNQVLLAAQAEISLEEHQRRIGEVVEVLVEGPSKKSDLADETLQGQLVGRTHADHLVVFPGNIRQIGQFLPVRITDATPNTLIGEVVTHELIAL